MVSTKRDVFYGRFQQSQARGDDHVPGTLISAVAASVVSLMDACMLVDNLYKLARVDIHWVDDGMGAPFSK